jgi:hypothetical protein
MMYGGKVQNALSVAQTPGIRAQNLQISAAASPVGFSNVIPTSAESHLQWLQ